MTSSFDLYLIRHGIAVERHPDRPDRDRPLTPKGQHKTTQVAQRLNQLGIHVPLICTSPYVRARQTAEILLTQGVGDRLDIQPELAPGGDRDRGLAAIVTQVMADQLAAVGLVGHEPDLSVWAEYLLYGNMLYGDPTGQIRHDAPFSLKKAGIIGLTVPLPLVEMPDQTALLTTALGQSQLFWFTPPRFLLG